MGVKIFDIIRSENISFKDLDNKVLVFDASLTIFQFMSTIRQADGSLLTDSKGNVTSHLIGLFSRTVNFMQKGMKLVFVFDGKPPELKSKEKERRKQLKKEALEKFEEARQEKDIEAMKKYAARTSYIDKDIIQESKSLLDALGIPIVQAPCEADAQMAHIVKKGDAYATVTQDADALLYATPRIVRNLSASLKKKSNIRFKNVALELISFKDVLKELDLTLNQLIVIGILIGTDYNVGGIKGIGSKKALKLIKQYGDDFDSLFKEVKWDEYFDYPWEDVFDTIKTMEVTDDYILDFKDPDNEKIIDLLCKKHDFSLDSVNNKLDKLYRFIEDNKTSDSSLNQWFG